MPDDSKQAASLYERDFHAWAVAQAELVRELERRRQGGDDAGTLRAAAALDLANLAEELDDLGQSERDALRSRLGTLCEHLLKLRFSPAANPRGQWRGTVLRSRREVMRRLRQSPSLRPEIPGLLAEAMDDAAEVVALELEARGELVAARTFAKIMREWLRAEAEGRALDDDFWPDPGA